MSYGGVAAPPKTGNADWDEWAAQMHQTLNRLLPPEADSTDKVLKSASEGELTWADGAPTFSQLTSLGLAFFTGEINAIVAATTSIGTVPAGKTMLSLGTYVMVQSVNSSSGTTNVTIKVDNGTLVVRSATVCGSTTVRNMQVLGGATGNNTQLDAGGSSVDVTVTVAATCPAMTIVVGVLGLLFETS